MDVRVWVYEALIQVILKGTYSNLYLKGHLRELPPQQRASATRIFYGTIQNYALCTYVWKQHVTRIPDPRIQVLLAMTIYQILYMDKVPDYAAVDDAVTIARRRFKKASGFVNGVLRNVLRHPVKLPADPLENTALTYSVPLWLMKLWTAQYGHETASSIAASSNAVLPVYVRYNPLKISPEAFFADPQIQPYNEHLGIFTGTDIASHPFYKEGKMSVQDPGSFMISQYVDPRPGESVLDVCAAPGTKTMAMAEQMHDAGSILANDLHAHRVQLMEQDARRLSLSIVKTMCADAAGLPETGTYDKVLCDVPCSGYGVFARKPDIKLRAKPEDMDALIPLQSAILERASHCVKAGGALVYSTCTINRKENEKQVEKFLKTHPDFILEKQRTIFPDDKENGFYMARLVRKQ